jgi:CheY-like chemotaxis protein/HPt (histidine-containing phosphotransfer) domain-containing protein
VGADGRPPRILLAEDSEAARELLKALLERMGCRVDTVSDGQEAIAQVCVEFYDAVFMDIEMPVLDGLSAALEIRKLHSPAAHVPIIALSALITDISSRPVLEAAFDAAIVKPARRDELHRVLQHVLTGPDRGRCRRELASPSESVAPQPIDDADLALIFGNLRQSERQALMRLAVRELESLGSQLNGAVAQRACDQVRHIVHRIRGTAANFAAKPLAAIATALENDCRAGLPADIASRSADLGAAVGAAVAALEHQCAVMPEDDPAKARARA